MRPWPTSARAILCIAATLLSLPLILASEKARPISSLTPDERAKLPDSTEVTLQSGKTVTLGTLRAEHKTRLERFSKAADLGRIASGKLKPQPAPPMQINPGVAGKGATPTGPDTNGRAGSNTSPLPTLVPFKMPSYKGVIPKDYADFCKAASPTVCLYLPGFSVLYRHDPGFWAADWDPLITSGDICNGYGGVFDSSGCSFFYPYAQFTSFKPTGPRDAKVDCPPPWWYQVDPKGEISAGWPPGDLPIYTESPTPVTCVVQVWNSKVSITRPQAGGPVR